MKKTKDMYYIELKHYILESEWYKNNDDLLFSKVKELKAKKIIDEMVGVKNGTNKKRTLC